MMGERLLCPECGQAKLKWISDLYADDLLENGLIECQNCQSVYRGIPGWEKAMFKKRGERSS